MTGTKRKFKIKKRQMDVADLYLKGLAQPDIAARLGMSQPTVSRDIKRMMEVWQDKAVAKVDERKAVELAKIDKLELTYWDAWERSLEEAISSTKERFGEAGTGAKAVTPTKIRETERKDKAIGDPRFLDGVQWCIEQRCTILGINAPATSWLGNFDINSLSTEQLRRISAGESIFQVLAGSTGIAVSS